MCYDRYTKQEIRDKFPAIYAAGVRAMRRFRAVTAHIDLPGLTVLSLKHYANWFLEELRPLVDRGQVVMLGCQYAASHAMCADEERDLQAGRLSMEIMRDELQADVASFFNQEIPFHPQTPYIMNQVGAKRLVLRAIDGWTRPRRVRGLDGSSIVLYPLDSSHGRPDALEALYDRMDDGDFVITGGDFEMLVNVEHVLTKIQELAAKGKVIEWTTVDRYEREVGITDWWDTPRVYGTAAEDLPDSPSFSRWVGDPEDMIWHGHAVQAMEGVRAAGFAALSARLHALDEVDVPLAQSWTTPPDNVWDQHFVEVLEYPEAEARYLSFDGTPTLLSRAWHHLLIGINSDASGWYPWTPRTRHRNTSLRASRGYADEVIARYAREVGARVARPQAEAAGYLLALNPAPARSVEVSLQTEGPMALETAEGTTIPTATSFQGGWWSARACLDLPAYGYALLGLTPSEKVEASHWTDGRQVQRGARSASLADEVLRIAEGDASLGIDVAPFRLSDPSGVAETEVVQPTWEGATTRVRLTTLGTDLDVLKELAWAVWLRLIVGLRDDRIEVTATVHVDMPRRICNLRYTPEGLLVQFRGAPGAVFYDSPYATIEHPNSGPSFVAAQRFAALESGQGSFGLVPLGRNQSFRLVGGEGIVAANLGASTEGRPDTRPQRIIRPDGTAEHRITSGSDPILGSYTHRFALVFGDRIRVAREARRLRTIVPLVRVAPGGGDWPAEQSLLTVTPDTAHVTAFRVTKDGLQVVVNDVSGQPGTTVAEGKRGDTADLDGYGVATLTI